MACGHALIVLLLSCLAVGLVAEASAEAAAEARASMMRRQRGAAQVHLGAGGELQMQEELQQGEGEAASPAGGRAKSRAVEAWLRMTDGGKTAAKQPGEVSWCDTAYPLGKADSNDCNHGKQAKILREEDCRHAAGVLGYTVGAPNFNVKDDWENPNPYAKDCFMVNDTVFFNPTESTRTSGWKGTPICEWSIYDNGTAEVDSDVACTGDYEEITSYTECEWAHDCQWGGMFCQEPNFGNDHYTTNEAPRGCYRNELGCYGFNARTTAPTGNLTGKQAVCRLKSYTFHPPAHTF